MIPSPPRAHASPRRASTSQALKKRRKVAFPGSHERECDLHRLGLARWWALARKHGKLHAEGAARPSGQGHKRAPKGLFGNRGLTSRNRSSQKCLFRLYVAYFDRNCFE